MKKYRYEAWDYKSPINGCKAENTGLLNKPQVYLLYQDSQIFQFQTSETLPEEFNTMEEYMQSLCDTLEMAFSEQSQSEQS